MEGKSVNNIYTTDNLMLVSKSFHSELIINNAILNRFVQTFLKDERITDEMKKEYMNKAGDYLFRNKEKPFVFTGFYGL